MYKLLSFHFLSSRTLAELSGRGVIFQMSSLPGTTWTVSASGGGISSGSSSTLLWGHRDTHTHTSSCLTWTKLRPNICNFEIRKTWYLFTALFFIWILFVRLFVGIKGSRIYCVQTFSPFAVYRTKLLFAADMQEPNVNKPQMSLIFNTSSLSNTVD